MALARDDLGRAARKRGIESQVTTIRHFGIRCMGLIVILFIVNRPPSHIEIFTKEWLGEISET